ncbi:MAG: hypothetical protein J1E05_06805 [Eubacterium sp.]|nr:hypothetical protein [Eubacterium sp.]
MKQTINTILSNLKPFGVYILSVLVGLGITFANEVIGFYLFFVVYLILGILIGVFTDLKKDKYGLIAYAVILAIAPLINLALEGQMSYTFGIKNVVYGIGSLCNMFCTYFTPFISSESFILRYVFAFVIALLPIAIGFGIKKVIKSKKA